MCDVCTDFLQLLESYETRITSNDAKHSILLKSEIEIAFGYIQAWPQRQCMCLYRDIKNFERFNLIVQSMICLTVHHLKHMESLLEEYRNQATINVQTRLSTQSPTSSPVPVASDKEATVDKASSSMSTTETADKVTNKNINKNDKQEESNKEIENVVKDNEADTAKLSIEPEKIPIDKEIERDNKSPTPPPPPPPRIKADHQAVVTSCQIIKPSVVTQYGEEHWILDEVDKLFLLVSKVFLLNFPLYIAFKHSTQARLDDISAEEAQHLSIFCDLHDNDIPVYLLRNVSLFCNSGGFSTMMTCFQQFDMPVSTAHAITSVVSNVKLWLNYSCIVQLFMPLRSRVLQYMCKLSDIKLRSAPIRNMADFVWSAVREPMDNSLTFDVEGLALAFKYFTSTTLTMRLAGMAQINAHVNLFNEICTSETVGEVEVMGTKMANWLTEHQIIQHLFGPNLHVEVIKQAPVVLTFLAVENKITDEHIKLIWQATQLKHCSKTVFDILPSLVKNLTPRPAMHLYSLLCRLEPKDHTEQSIYIASALTKLIWSRDHSRPQMGLALHEQHMIGMHTSSESGSMDGSQSDDEAGNGDDSSLASGRKSPIDIETMGSDTGVTPCKQARRRRHICDPTNEKQQKQLNDEELNLLHPKVDMKLQNHRIVNILEHSSSEDDLQATALEMQMHRKKSRKRRKNNSNNNNSNNQLPQLAHEIVEAIWDGGEEDASSDELDDDEENVLQDSDECSDSISQVLPSDVIKHLHGEGPFIRAIAETHISELLSGPENDGSYSSPLSNKSEKNLADFDDEDVSPCEEELAHLVGTIGRVAHGSIPPAFAQAAAAMAVAHNAMSMTKTDANVAAAAAAVTAAAAATVTAQQSLEAMRQQASAVAKGAIAAAAVAAAASQSKTSTCESDIDVGDLSKDSPRASISSTCSGNSQKQLTFKLNDVCLPGNTLLWDLLQDEKISQLGEALALEAENALASLLCFSVDRLLRTKFIEGCMHNLANNRSVVVSLRLLPKIFASFQQFRPTDTHQVTLWAERQHRMMYHFFNNIKYYAKQHAELLSKNAEQVQTEQHFYTHKTQVSVRLHFLSSIFSSLGSPKTFRLSLDQVDALWEWLAHDPECSDCYFSWLQNQAKGGSQHALGLEALQHIYLKKLPELRPEDFSMVALGLFQQLCSLARIALSQYEKHKDLLSTSSNVVGMFHLWKIALRAHNTEVSLAAIQYINMYYMGQQLRLEKEFVSQCMDNLVQATNALESNEDENALMCVQRGLMLLNTHLETFRRRYAFHLRRWAIEGKGIASHSNLKNEGNGPTLRIIVQPHGLSDKTVLQMHACDLIAELKAEISKWWENYQSNSNSGVTAPVLGLLLSEGPLRIITQGQELTPEYDERSLGDAGFKDNQIVQISQGVPGTRRNLDHPSMQPPPPKECLPTVLLLQPKYFEKLFCLMQTLGDMKPQNNNLQLYTKAQLLSRRVWDILAILPTNPLILDAFKNLTSDLANCEPQQQLVVAEEQANKRKEIKQRLVDLLDPSNLQKFMYSLHIVESLTMNCVQQQHKVATTTSYINGGDSGLVGEQHQQQQHLHVRGPRTATARKNINRRRSNNNENSIMKEKIHERGESVKRSHSAVITEISSHKDSSDSSSTHKEPGGGSTNESEQSEAGSSSNDKENNPLKQNKRHKKATDGNMEGDQLLDQLEKERVMGMQKNQTVVNSTSGPESPTARVMETKWSDAFIKCGGLKILYDIFISGQLQCSAHPKELLNEWRHDCLASLLRILWLLGFDDFQSAELHVNISKPRPFMLDLMEVDGCLRRLSSILNDEAYQNYQMPSGVPYQFHQYHNVRTGFWGRASVVQFAINMTVSFVHAAPEARRLIWTQTEYCNWVQKFILDDPDPSVRREVCAGLYRICLGNPHNYQLLLAPLLRKLISFLPAAEKMTSHTPHTQFLLSEEGKEPYGPACRDYFWLLSRLVDTLSPELNKNPLESSGDKEPQTIDIERLCDSVSQSILSRDFYETRHGNQDDALVGLINLMSNLVKYDPTFKFSPCAAHFIDKLLEFLFDMPSPSNRQNPKCKSATSRAACYDLLVELCRNCPENYAFLHEKLIAQHTPTGKQTYPWDYWPRDEGRSECGYVGLTNLGATCYMASCVQHLYMMPQARAAIIQVPPNIALKHGPTLVELQRMFAYLLESERKAYNPRSFCRVYQMDHQPLNTGEQKDMAEFFIDLVSKLEEMTPDLKDLVKTLFCGTLSNNVVSLDCEHVSRTAEEFYTVRCQVADMRNLQESLDEVTVKDTLEGDNMYTCSQCGKKVRAEKRACFKKLPQILCFNTMRYTFNMVTMLKEKVNTHFSFPMRLNMIDYVEKTLMPHQYKEDREKRKQKLEEQMKDAKEGGEGDEKTDIDNKTKNEALEDDEDLEECLEYELVGVTVHTGTADGGHYYSFIKERNEGLTQQHDRWFLFNDAEVKPFDPSQIGAECFGGEMTSKTYDSVTEKYLDFSFEKTNSAYMLFYERRLPEHLKQRQSELLASPLANLKIEELGKLGNKVKDSATEEEGAGNDCDNTSTSSSEAIKTLTAMLLNDSNGESCDEKKGTSNNRKFKKSGEVKKNELSIVANAASAVDVNANNDANDDYEGDEPQASTSAAAALKQQFRLRPRLNKELEDWIWQDNRQFLQDRNIFEHTYFNFMWQICGHIPQTLAAQADVSCMAAKLSVSFFLETFIHAKEKQPTMVPWVELLTKQFSASQEACEWFLGHMSQEPWWPVQVLVQCPNQVVRQMFQRLILHVINKLRPTHVHMYLKNENENDSKSLLGAGSCVTRFISALVLLMEHGARPHVRHLTEYFSLLQEFARLGEEETMFMLRICVIKSVADFYLGHKTHETVDVGSDNEDNSSDEALAVDKTRPAALEKMIALVTNLVERSRGADFRLRLSTKDFSAIAGGKGLPFLYQQIKDNINAHQTKNLIHALCRWDERLANHIVGMLISSVTKHTELCAPFFKLLTLLADTQGAPAGLPCFSQLILQRVWDAAEYCPQAALEWLSFQAPKNKIAHAWILQTSENWVEQFLLAHNNARVRSAAAYLIVSLVPSQQFRASFRAHALHKITAFTHHAYRELSGEAETIVHTLMNLLLRLLRTARVYADIGMHGTNKLTAYFGLLSYMMVSKTEKILVAPYMRNLWDLFHPRLSEPSVPAHHNKHALLSFWHHSLSDCPENALAVANNPEITRNIAFNYILADHEDTEIVAYNRAMLPMYYGMLRMCCEQSRSLTRQLSGHQNLQWAFKNITPHPTQYTQAVEELFKLMRLFATRHPDASEQEQLEVTTFRRTTLSSYLASLDARVSWSTLINALQILVDNEDDRLLVIYNGGIEMCFDALHTLHSMHHEATACHVVGDLQELLHELILLLATLRSTARQDSASSRKHVEKQAQLLQQQHEQLLQKQHEQLKLQHATQSQTEQQQQQQQTPQQQTTSQQKEKQMAQMQQHLQLQQMQQHLQQHHYLRQQHQSSCLLKGLPEAIKRLATLLNTYNPPELTRLVLDVLKEMVRNSNLDAINILTPILLNSHLTASTAPNSIGPLGVYFPRRNKSPWPISKLSRPPRPMLQMSMPHGEVFSRGSDAEHDALVEAFYKPYHDFVDVMLRMAVNKDALNESLVKLSCLLGIEASGLHFNLFPKFWVGIFNNKSTNKYAELLINNPMLIEYIHLVLRDERKSLGDQYIRNFLEIYYPKVSHNLPIPRLIYTITYAMHAKEDIDDLCGDLFAIRVIAQATGVPTTARKQLRGSLKALLHKSARYLEEAKNGIIANKKQKLEEDLIKTTAKRKDKENSNNSPTQRYAAELLEIMRRNMETGTSSDITCLEDEEKTTVATSTTTTAAATAKTTSSIVMDKIKDTKIVKMKSREGTPSTASEDETEIEPDKIIAENVKISTVDPSDDDDDEDDDDDNDDHDIDDDDEDDEGGLITACGPVFASSTLSAKNKNVASTSGNNIIKAAKSNKNTACESVSSDDNSIYTIHKSSTTSRGSGERLTVTLAKNSNKKTATDRQLAEHEKRCKMLHTMESYIRSILALMQKDEEPSSSSAITNVHKPMDTEVVTFAGSSIVSGVPRKTNSQKLGSLGDTTSSSEDGGISTDRKLKMPKSPSTTPPPLAPLSNSHTSAIVKTASTATIIPTTIAANNVHVDEDDDDDDDDDEDEAEAMSIGHEDDEEVEDRSMTEATTLPNGDDVDVDDGDDDDVDNDDALTPRANVATKVIATTVQADTANSSTTTMETVDSLEESDIITSSPASPVSEMLTSATLEPSQL